MTAITLTCRTCGDMYPLGAGEQVRQCPSCGTVNCRPQAEGESLHMLYRAAQQRLRCDFHNAESSYQHVLRDYPDEHEALWGLVLCRYGVEYVEDPRTGRRMPVVHTVRARPMQLDTDFLLACDCAPEAIRAQYEAEAGYIDEAMGRIRELAESCPPYDVFICHKTSRTDGVEGYTEDYNRAFKLYHRLTMAGYRVFFAPTEMDNVVGADYEAGIYHALETSRVMLVICSDPAYITSPWVRSEWQRFLEMMDDDPGRRVLPLLYAGMLPRRLPREFTLRRLQAVIMEDMDAWDTVVGALRVCCGGGKAKGAEVTAPAPVPVNDGVKKAVVAQKPAWPAPSAPAPVNAGDKKSVTLEKPAYPAASYPVGPAATYHVERPELTTSANSPVGSSSGKSGTPATQTILPGTERQAASPEATQEHRFTVAELNDGVSITGNSGPGGLVKPPPVPEKVRLEKSLPHEDERAQRPAETTEPDAMPGGRMSDFLTAPKNGGLEIVSYRGEQWHVRIPAKIFGKPVVGIGERAFEGRRQCVIVEIAEGVRYIHSQAFLRSGLKRIVLPSTMTQIAEDAFWRCFELSEIIVEDNPVYSVRDGVLMDSRGTLCLCPLGLKLKEYAVPEGIRRIGGHAFSDHDELVKIVLPEGIESIGMWAFAECRKLEQLTLPQSLTSIERHAFSRCHSLYRLRLPDGLAHMETDSFAECRVVLHVRRFSTAHRLLEKCGVENVVLHKN